MSYIFSLKFDTLYNNIIKRPSVQTMTGFNQRFGYETTQLDNESIIALKAAKKIFFDKMSVNSIKKFVLRRSIESLLDF